MQGSTAQLSQVQQLKPRPQMLGSQATNSVGGWDSRMGTTGSRVAIPPARGPEATTSENLGVKPEARRRYETLFKSVSSGEYIEGNGLEDGKDQVYHYALELTSLAYCCSWLML